MSKRSEVMEQHAVCDSVPGYQARPAQTAPDYVPPGYKRTDVGVIPEDWRLDHLGSHCERITKGTTPTSLGKTFTSSGISFVKAESITEEGGVFEEKLAYIDGKTHELLERSQLAAGDVLISIAGVLGRVGCISPQYLPANTNQALAIIRLKDKTAIDGIYLPLVLRGGIVQQQIRDINVRAAQANISLKDVSDFLVPLPGFSEQRAIAAALSDADALIESFNRLIAKKRGIKQAAMQQLLTGQTRLPGFAGPWEQIPLEYIADIRNGGTPSTIMHEFWDGGIPWCTPTDITALGGRKYLTETERTISSKGLQASSAESIPPNSIIMTTRATIGE